MPVGFYYNPKLATIDVTGFTMATSQKFRNAGSKVRVWAPSPSVNCLTHRAGFRLDSGLVFETDDAASNSITRMLAHFGVRNYARKSSHVTAAIAEAADAAVLRIALGRPLLVVDSIDVDADGAPVLMTHARFAADRLELVIEP